MRPSGHIYICLLPQGSAPFRAKALWQRLNEQVHHHLHRCGKTYNFNTFSLDLQVPLKAFRDFRSRNQKKKKRCCWLVSADRQKKNRRELLTLPPASCWPGGCSAPTAHWTRPAGCARGGIHRPAAGGTAQIPGIGEGEGGGFKIHGSFWLSIKSFHHKATITILISKVPIKSNQI